MSLTLTWSTFLSVPASAECVSDQTQFWVCKGDVAPITGYLVPKELFGETVRLAELGQLLESYEPVLAEILTGLQVVQENQQVLREVVVPPEPSFDWTAALVGFGVGTVVTTAIVVGSFFAFAR